MARIATFMNQSYQMLLDGLMALLAPFAYVTLLAIW
jgi:hypothetical protein